MCELIWLSLLPLHVTIGNFQFMVLLYEYSHKKILFWFICVGFKNGILLFDAQKVKD